MMKQLAPRSGRIAVVLIGCAALGLAGAGYWFGFRSTLVSTPVAPVQENEGQGEGPTLVVQAWKASSPFESDYEQRLKNVGQPTPQEFQERFPPPKYLGKLSFDPTKAKFYDEFQHDNNREPKMDQYHWFDFKLNADEERAFRDNGFVVSERLGAMTFLQMYQRIYARDLPVYITVDSILHAWHRSYDKMLEEIEIQQLSPALLKMLGGMAEKVPAMSKSVDHGPLA